MKKTNRFTGGNNTFFGIKKGQNTSNRLRYTTYMAANK